MTHFAAPGVGYAPPWEYRPGIWRGRVPGVQRAWGTTERRGLPGPREGASTGRRGGTSGLCVAAGDGGPWGSVRCASALGVRADARLGVPHPLGRGGGPPDAQRRARPHQGALRRGPAAHCGGRDSTCPRIRVSPSLCAPGRRGPFKDQGCGGGGVRGLTPRSARLQNSGPTRFLPDPCCCTWRVLWKNEVVVELRNGLRIPRLSVFVVQRTLSTPSAGLGGGK